MPRIVISNWDSFRKSIPFSMRICLSIFFQLGSPSLQVRCLQLLVELKSSFHNLRNQVRPTTASTRNTSFQKTTKKKKRPLMTHVGRLEIAERELFSSNTFGSCKKGRWISLFGYIIFMHLDTQATETTLRPDLSNPNFFLEPAKNSGKEKLRHGIHIDKKSGHT